MNYGFHPAAEAEHLEQIVFYESQSSVRPTFDAVRLRAFPVALIYRERNAAVQVLAVSHYRRRPGYWLGRVV